MALPFKGWYEVSVSLIAGWLYLYAILDAFWAVVVLGFLFWPYAVYFYLKIPTRPAVRS